MELIKNNKTLIFLLFFTLCCLMASVGHYANILIDVGREVYYPKIILEGKVLYKDIFCIYGPFSYLLNALAYKILGIKLASLYFMGILTTLINIFFTYKISRKFLPEFYSFSITSFVILTGCLTVRIFNYTLPYSYAVLYGLCCFLISVYFLICHVENKKQAPLLLSALFAGFAISNKYDFIFYIIPVIFIILKTKSPKIILKSLSALVFGFCLPFIILFIQGLQVQDIISSLQTIKAFTFTSALKTFYVTQGVYYTDRVWGEWFFEILFLLIYLSFIVLGVSIFSKEKVIFKILGSFFVLFGANFAICNVQEDSYLFLTFFTALFFVFTFKKNTFAQNVFIISSILSGAKSFWGLSHVNYGLYFIPFILISFFILCSNSFSKKITLSISILVLSMAIGIGINNFDILQTIKGKLQSQKGQIYTLKDTSAPTNEVINYINNIKAQTPSVMIYPEGLMLNFLSSKETKTNDMYNSLIPLYTEGFGENKIIESFDKNKIDYIILSNLTSESYRKGEICRTYGYNICAYILSNYTPIYKTESGKETKYIIFKRN